MLEFITNEFIKSGGLKEDLPKLLELSENLDFDPQKVKTQKIVNDFNHGINTYTIIYLKGTSNHIYIHYNVSHSNIADQISATLENYSDINNSIKFTTKIHTTKNGKQTIKQFRGYIISHNREIYTFSKNNDNTITIKYYDTKDEKMDDYSQKVLRGLSFEKIITAPNEETILELDYTENTIQNLNYLFRNPQLIIDSIQKTTTKKR